MTLPEANDYIERLNRRIDELYKEIESEMIFSANLQKEIERLNKLLKDRK